MSGVDISKLNVQQLTYLTKQLEEENTLLTANFNQLKQAHAKFLDAAACMKILGEEREREYLLFAVRVCAPGVWVIYCTASAANQGAPRPPSVRGARVFELFIAAAADHGMRFCPGLAYFHS